MTVDNLGFREWPFATVPTRERGKGLWADRRSTREQIDAVLADWLHTNRSTITLVWADLGAGKTHTLFYLEGLCSSYERLVPMYVLLPSATVDFLSLYKAIARELDWDTVATRWGPGGRSLLAKNLRRALDWFQSEVDNTRQLLAQSWLSGERLKPRDCQTLGVSGPIASQDEAVQILSMAFDSLSADGERLVLMIDEYQRVAEGNRKQLQQIGHGLHTVYNACASGLSLVLSCATGMTDDYATVLTPEIVSRLSAKRIELAYLTVDDAIDYVRDVFGHYRISGLNVPEFFPLTAKIVSEYATFLVNGLEGELTPRRLNEGFNELLSFARRSSTELAYEDFVLWLAEQRPTLIRRVMA